MREGFGAMFIDYFDRCKRAEAARWNAAEDKRDFDSREYFSRI